MNTVYKDYTNRLKEGEEWKKEKPLSDDEIEVLGNIHGNPELMEVGR